MVAARRDARDFFFVVPVDPVIGERAAHAVAVSIVGDEIPEGGPVVKAAGSAKDADVIGSVRSHGQHLGIVMLEDDRGQTLGRFRAGWYEQKPEIDGPDQVLGHRGKCGRFSRSERARQAGEFQYGVGVALDGDIHDSILSS